MIVTRKTDVWWADLLREMGLITAILICMSLWGFMTACTWIGDVVVTYFESLETKGE